MTARTLLGRGRSEGIVMTRVTLRPARGLCEEAERLRGGAMRGAKVALFVEALAFLTGAAIAYVACKVL